MDISYRTYALKQNNVNSLKDPSKILASKCVFKNLPVEQCGQAVT